MSTNTIIFTEKEMELIAVGASIATGCQPCLRYHLRAARNAGASEEDIHQAFRIAFAVRRRAAAVMANLVKNELGGRVSQEAQTDADDADKSLIGELISVGAAFAVNCVMSFKEHIATARQLGATDCHIETVVTIARAVKDMAGKKIDAVTPGFSSAVVDFEHDCVCHTASDKAAASSVEACCTGVCPEVRA